MGEDEKKPLCLACHHAGGLTAKETTAQCLYLLGVGQGICLATGCDHDLAEFAERTRAITKLLCADCRILFDGVGDLFCAALDAANRPPSPGERPS